MKKAATLITVIGLASAANAGLSLDDLSIATLNGGDTIMGDTTGASDDMNGNGGIRTAPGIGWTGGDDVYTLVWGGGDMIIDLTFSNAAGDIDIFLFDNNNPTEEVAQGISIDDNESMELLGAAAGTYYISVDGWGGETNTYSLSVSNDVPAPTALAALGLGGLVAGRRRR